MSSIILKRPWANKNAEKQDKMEITITITQLLLLNIKILDYFTASPPRKEISGNHSLPYIGFNF